MHRKMGRHQVKTTLEEGCESAKSNQIEHPIVKGNSPPIQRTDKGRIHSCIFTLDGDPRAKYIASKHLCAKYYTILLLRMAHAVSTPYNTILQLPHRERLAIRQSRYKQYHLNTLHKQGATHNSKIVYRLRSPLAVPSSTRDPTGGYRRLYPTPGPQGLDTITKLKVVYRRTTRPSCYPPRPSKIH